MRRLCVGCSAFSSTRASLHSSPPIEPTPAERLEEQFRLYLERERRLAPATVFHYLVFARRFLAQLPRRWRAAAGCFACGRCGGLCPARGSSAASSQTRQVDDRGPALVPAVRALHRPDRYRFASECSGGGELVDGLASAGTVRGGRPTPSCPLRSAHGGRASQLGDSASACPLGIACRGSGRLGARGSRLGSGRAAGSGIRRAIGIGCRYPRMWERPWSTICVMRARTVPRGGCSCAREPRIEDSPVRWQLAASFAAHLSVQDWIHPTKARTCCATRWPPKCYGKAPRSPRSASCYATAARRPR